MDEGSRIYRPGYHLPRMGRYDQMVCPQICSTDVNVFMCQTHLAVSACGVAA
jgi:hypothetical protein